jgi:hypothetical protein
VVGVGGGVQCTGLPCATSRMLPVRSPLHGTNHACKEAGAEREDALVRGSGSWIGAGAMRTAHSTRSTQHPALALGPTNGPNAMMGIMCDLPAVL